MSTIGVHVSLTNANDHQYPWREAIRNYLEFAHEVVVVDGNSTDGTLEELQKWAAAESRLKVIVSEWPKDNWHFSQFPKNLNIGLHALNTDWRIKIDIDSLINENDFPALFYSLNQKAHQYHGATLTKFVVVNTHAGYVKTQLPFILNYSGKVVYGRAEDQDSDWSYPIVWDGRTVDEFGVPLGKAFRKEVCYVTDIKVWDYDYFFNTKERARKRFWNMAQAWGKVHDANWGSTEDESWKVFIGQATSRLKKQLIPLDIDSHPRVIRERLKLMTPDMWGHSNWDLNFD